MELKRFRVVWVTPMTTVKRPLPTRVEAHVGRKRGCICLDPIRTIDTAHITSPIAVLPPATQHCVRDVLRQAFMD